MGVNNGMQNTIKTCPEKFELYNNGLSIIGEISQSATDIIIHNPIFINGQQTLLNLMLAKEAGIDLKKVIVPVFVKSQNDQSERLNIARFNNTQQQVKEIDLLSLNSGLRNIQAQLLKDSLTNGFNEDCYFLRIISNGKRNIDNTIKQLYSKNQIIDLDDFVRSYWIAENQTMLGKWKNNISHMIKCEIMEKNYLFDHAKAKKICGIIRQYYNFIDSIKDRDNYKVADVVIIYLLQFYDMDTVKRIVDYINQTIYPNKKPKVSKLIDIYKSDNVLNDIKEAKQSLGIK